ncbi:hypothetical protein Syun_024700 [Stephania yunnanensis]|uniref:Endonuclease V n=1 Tax=Stephania yunnanensis TaxID=152371 RepID=A0AAP0EST7_9MAGN
MRKTHLKLKEWHIVKNPDMQSFILTKSQTIMRKALVLVEIFPIFTKVLTFLDHMHRKQKLQISEGLRECESERDGGCSDVRFSVRVPSMATATEIIILEITIWRVFFDYSLVKLHIPYIPGFLAFREAPVLLELLDKMRRQAHPFFPQLLMVDGNGLLHPRGKFFLISRFGLACHVGVLANLPTIGVGKNLHHVDGLTQASMRQLLEAKENTAKDLIPLTGCSGRTWGVAMRTTGDSLRPIYVSVGHRIALDTAAKVVKMACKYRVPEPIRQADIRSRAFLQKHQFAYLQFKDWRTPYQLESCEYALYIAISNFRRAEQDTIYYSLIA